MVETVRQTARVKFRALSWQELLATHLIPGDIRDWAAEKHGLLAAPAA